MSGGSLPWFAHLLVVLAWHIQALAGPGSGYAWAAPGACRVGVRGCAQVAGQHARAARRVRLAAGGRGRSVGTAGERKKQIAREHVSLSAQIRAPIRAAGRPRSTWRSAGRCPCPLAALDCEASSVCALLASSRFLPPVREPRRSRATVTECQSQVRALPPRPLMPSPAPTKPPSDLGKPHSSLHQPASLAQEERGEKCWCPRPILATSPQRRISLK